MEMHMNTPTKFLFVIDTFQTLKLRTETSLVLSQDLIKQGQDVCGLQQEDLAQTRQGTL